MPQNSPNFNLPYFVRGSDYSARSDYRRFVALDYNMESYVGIIGIGVLDGWTIEQVSGTTKSSGGILIIFVLLGKIFRYIFRNTFLISINSKLEIKKNMK